MPLWNPWSPHSFTHLQDCGGNLYKAFGLPCHAARLKRVETYVPRGRGLVSRASLSEIMCSFTVAFIRNSRIKCCVLLDGTKNTRNSMIQQWSKCWEQEQVLEIVGVSLSGSMLGKESHCWQSAEVGLKMLTSRNTARVQGCD